MSIEKEKRKFWPRVKRKNFSLDCLCSFCKKLMRHPRKNQLFCAPKCKQAAFQERKDLKDVTDNIPSKNS